jgi:hypothetical protein
LQSVQFRAKTISADLSTNCIMVCWSEGIAPCSHNQVTRWRNVIATLGLGKELMVPSMRLGGLQIWSGYFGEEKIMFISQSTPSVGIIRTPLLYSHYVVWM